MLIGLPRIFREWALEVKTLADIHAVEMLRHWTIWVSFDDEVKIARLICRMVNNLWALERQEKAEEEKNASIPSSLTGV
jgi:hypothetical protein